MGSICTYTNDEKGTEAVPVDKSPIEPPEIKVFLSSFIQESIADDAVESKPDEEKKSEPPEVPELKEEPAKIEEPPERDLEEDFQRMMQGIEPEDYNVREKLTDLGPFNYDIRDSTQGLQLIEGITEGDETYYGFM